MKFKLLQIKVNFFLRLCFLTFFYCLLSNNLITAQTYFLMSLVRVAPINSAQACSLSTAALLTARSTIMSPVASRVRRIALYTATRVLRSTLPRDSSLHDTGKYSCCRNLSMFLYKSINVYLTNIYKFSKECYK